MILTKNNAGEMRIRGTKLKLRSNDEISPDDRLMMVEGLILTKDF